MNKILSDLIKEFLEYKKKNGYVYAAAGYHLNKYLDFSTSHSPGENIPGRDTVNAFLNKYAGTPGNLYNIAAALREFSRYLISLGYTSAYVIPQGKISLPTPVQPYLFTDDEIAAFLLPVTASGMTAMCRRGISCCRQCTDCFIAVASAARRPGP